jgi:hypothetical protein
VITTGLIPRGLFLINIEDYMAVYRQIQTTFWQDAFVLSLTPEEKYFYIYLFTNSKTKQCGIYELPLQIAQIETGYNRETVVKLIQKFIEFGKVKYDWHNSELLLVNWMKYNPVRNPLIKKCVDSELSDVKNPDFIEFFNTHTNGYCNKNKNNNKKKKNNNNKSVSASPPVVLPQALDNDRFRQTWDEFKRMRAEIKKPLRDTAERKQLEALAKHGLDTAIKMVEQSTANQWQGIFELKNGGNNGTGNRTNGTNTGGVTAAPGKYDKFMANRNATPDGNPKPIHGQNA